MNFKDTVKSMLLRYPGLFRNRLDACMHLFIVNGNGYEWHRGQLIDKGYSETSQFELRDAIKGILQDAFLFEYSRPSSYFFANKSEEELDEEFKKLYNRKYENLFEEIDMCFRIDERFEDFEIPDPEKYAIWKRELNLRNQVKKNMYTWTIYPICQYAQICNVPDDIENDWLKAADETLKFVEEHVEMMTYHDMPDTTKWIDFARKKIDEIKKEREENE